LIIFITLYHGAALARLPIAGWHARDWLPPLLALCLSVPVAIRRREPVLALAVILAACALVLVLRGELTRGPILPLAIVLFLVAATRSRRAALAALAASLALLTVQGVILSLTGRGAGNAVGAGLILIICWMIGYSVGQRRSYAARLQQQAMGNAITAERLRIARELHDVVAHSMTVVAVQAGLRRVRVRPAAARGPGRARRDPDGDQRGAGRHAADARRAPPGRGRDGGRRGARPGGRGGEPADPGAGRRSAGARARPGRPGPAGGGHGRGRHPGGGAADRAGPGHPGRNRLSAFRIIQEALTNVVKHSGADRCLVRIAHGAGQLSVEITDPGQRPVPAPAAGGRALALAGAPARAAAGPGGTGIRAGLAAGGHGIAGMRERVGLCGGEFAAGPLPGRGFRVAARFPLPGGAR
jgi:signal transduction histidine kinase